jgi:hypothetical protein
MRNEKYLDIMAGIFFIAGLALCYFTLHSSDFLFSMFGIGMLIISSFHIGKKEAYKEYNNLHYTILEGDAKKRREKDEELSKKVHEDIKNYEKEHSED